jgi:hypothetical protein
MPGGEVRKICRDTGRHLTNDSKAHGRGALSAKISQIVGLPETVGENEGIGGGRIGARSSSNRSGNGLGFRKNPGTDRRTQIARCQQVDVDAKQGLQLVLETAQVKQGYAR